MASRTIGQLAKDAGVPTDTVRYYERIGLLPRRSSAGTGWRRYTDEIFVRLCYLREGRAAGFTLRELRNLLNLTTAGAPRFCESFDAAVQKKIGAIDQMISRLTAQRERLQQFSRDCRERRKEGRCLSDSRKPATAARADVSTSQTILTSPVSDAPAGARQTPMSAIIRVFTANE